MNDVVLFIVTSAKACGQLHFLLRWFCFYVGSVNIRSRHFLSVHGDCDGASFVLVLVRMHASLLVIKQQHINWPCSKTSARRMLRPGLHVFLPDGWFMSDKAVSACNSKTVQSPWWYMYTGRECDTLHDPCVLAHCEAVSRDEIRWLWFAVVYTCLVRIGLDVRLAQWVSRSNATQVPRSRKYSSQSSPYTFGDSTFS